MQTNIGPYAIKKIIGQGGMATVYASFDPRRQQDVAIKVLPHALLHDPTFRTRFDREIQMLDRLRHPYIVPVYDHGQHEGQPFLVMPFMRGGTLENLLTQGPLSIEQVRIIIRRISEALHTAHQQGIIHRDLKPGNILFDQDENAYLSDFGIARLSSGTQTTLTKTGGAVGTPGYMSPEQIQGRPVDQRSDIYALGVLLYEMLSGQKPFTADTPAMIIVQQMTEGVPDIQQINPTLLPGYSTLIRQMTANDRTIRPEQVIEVPRLLGSASTVTPPPAPPTQAFQQKQYPNSLIRELSQMGAPSLPPPRQQRKGAKAAETAVSRIPCPYCESRTVVRDHQNRVRCQGCYQTIELVSHLCPYCQTYHPDSEPFCYTCGAAMERHCGQCETVNWSGNDRCANCHASLDLFENLRYHQRDISTGRQQKRLSDTQNGPAKRPSSPKAQTASPNRLGWIIGIALLVALLALLGMVYLVFFW